MVLGRKPYVSAQEIKGCDQRKQIGEPSEHEARVCARGQEITLECKDIDETITMVRERARSYWTSKSRDKAHDTMEVAFKPYTPCRQKLRYL